MNKYLQLAFILIGSGVVGYTTHVAMDAFFEWFEHIGEDKN